MDVRGHWVLITGASSGMGALFAAAFAGDGAHLILVARRAERLEALADQLRRQHRVEVEVQAVDLTAPGAVAELVSAATADGRAVHTLVNNAGFGVHGHFVDVPAERTLSMVRLNVTVLTELCTALVPAMVHRRQGGVLNVASVQAYLSAPHYAAYAATKAYVRQFTEALHIELLGTGVHATVLCPGVTKTEFLEVAGHELDWLQRIGLGEPEPVVAAGMRGLYRNQMTVIPGGLNWLTAWFMPRLWQPLHVRVLAWILAAR